MKDRGNGKKNREERKKSRLRWGGGKTEDVIGKGERDEGWVVVGGGKGEDRVRQR